jgi:hypothetical protein
LLVADDVAVDDLIAASAGGWIDFVVIRRHGGANGALGFGGTCPATSGQRREDGTDGDDTKSKAREVLRRHKRLQTEKSAMYGARIS